jgi:hypothetical protein
MVSTQDRTDSRPWMAACDPKTRKPVALPKEKGVYEWRIPHAFLHGLKVEFLAHMRMRGGCGDDFLFPVFDRWTGWEAVIPAGVEWREAIDPPEFRVGDYSRLRIEGDAPEDCPFCGRTPTFDAAETGGGNGIVVCGVPHRYDRWTLKCCSWTGRPSARDPRDLISMRKAALAKFRCPGHA